MFGLIKNFFAPENEAEVDAEAAARVAAAAILVEAGRSDDCYDEAEREIVKGALAKVYQLDARQAAELEKEGGAALDAALDYHRFTSALKGATTVKDRADFLTEVWKVVLADGRRDPAEDAFMRKLAGLLQVPDRESGLARRRAEQA